MAKRYYRYILPKRTNNHCPKETTVKNQETENSTACFDTKTGQGFETEIS